MFIMITVILIINNKIVYNIIMELLTRGTDVVCVDIRIRRLCFTGSNYRNVIFRGLI